MLGGGVCFAFRVTFFFFSGKWENVPVIQMYPQVGVDFKVSKSVVEKSSKGGFSNLRGM